MTESGMMFLNCIQPLEHQTANIFLFKISSCGASINNRLGVGGVSYGFNVFPWGCADASHSCYFLLCPLGGAGVSQRHYLYVEPPCPHFCFNLNPHFKLKKPEAVKERLFEALLFLYITPLIALTNLLISFYAGSTSDEQDEPTVSFRPHNSQTSLGERMHLVKNTTTTNVINSHMKPNN